MDNVNKQHGSVILGVLLAVTSILALAFGGLAIWAYMQ